MARELTARQIAERSIIKEFRKWLWAPFLEAVNRYNLIAEGDKIAVCISGGKDSMLLAKLMQQLQRVSKVPFELVFLVMDPGYAPANRKKIEDNAELLGIPIDVFESEIFDVANAAEQHPCYLCARMRRGNLYAEAKARGCNKIALGHHLNDVIETTLMGMAYAGQLQGMMPKIKSKNFEGMELIRPLFCVKEQAIIDWRDHNHLEFLQCACRFTEQAERENREHLSKRKEMKELIAQMKQNNPLVEECLFSAVHSVCLDTFPGYSFKGDEFDFNQVYAQKNNE